MAKINKGKYTKLPELREGDFLTSMVAKYGSKWRKSVFYFDEKHVYLINQGDVGRARKIMNSSGKHYHKYIDLDEPDRHSKEYFKEFFEALSKYGLNEKHIFFYKGKKYTMGSLDVLEAEKHLNSIKNNSRKKTTKKSKKGFCKLPDLRKTSSLTSFIAENGSIRKTTILYVDEEHVYYARPKTVLKARKTMCDSGVDSSNYVKDVHEFAKKPSIVTCSNDFLKAVGKYANANQPFFWYKGSTYIIDKEFFWKAKQFVNVLSISEKKEKRKERKNRKKKKANRSTKPKKGKKEFTNRLATGIEYDPQRLPELKPRDILTEKVSKCNINHGEIIKHGDIYYRVFPKDVERAILIVEEQMKLNRESRRSSTWSEKVKQRDNHTCQHCGSGEKLHAHHILGFAQHPEKAQVVDNGITLCEKCHTRFHTLHGVKDFGEKELEVFLKYGR